MEYRTRKQIIIGAVYLLIFVGISAAVYYGFLKSAPSCFDGFKNQDEEEIDCGGTICEDVYNLSCELKTLKDVEVVWAQVIPVTKNVYDFAAKIRNPNPNYGTSDLRYTFILKDKNGQPLGTGRQGLTFILPNASKYLIENNFEINGEIGSLEIEIDTGDKNSWQKIQDYQAKAVNLIVKDKKFEKISGAAYFAEATGVVKNDTDFDFDRVNVSVLLFDKGQKPVGALKTEMRTMLSGEERGFSVRWYYPLIAEVLYPEMQAETNLFLDENFMEKQGQGQIEI